MPFSHSNVYIVRVSDTAEEGQTSTWYVGPYGPSRAGQVAAELEHQADGAEAIAARVCSVEPLYSDDECLRVDDYTRVELGSLY